LVDCDAACNDPRAKFKAAKAKAKKVGVENLSQDDVKGLSQAQLKELRLLREGCRTGSPSAAFAAR
jgi:hypothetical protein